MLCYSLSYYHRTRYELLICSLSDEGEIGRKIEKAGRELSEHYRVIVEPGT